MNTTLSLQDLHWLAGWLEGEGSFTLESHRAGSKGQYRGVPYAQRPVTYRYPAIYASSTDLDVINKAAGLMGSRVWIQTKANPRCKTCWQTRLRGENALLLMAQLLPLMGSRRSTKIKELLGTDS